MDEVIAMISPQVDRLNVVLNQYQTVPVELARYPNVVPVIPEDDLKDTGKFYPDVREAKYVMLIDDDIFYPPDYVSKTVSRFETLPLQKCMGGYHGSLYFRPSIRQMVRSPRLLFSFKKGWRNFVLENYASIRNSPRRPL